MSRGTHREFGYAAIVTFFVFYFVGAVLAAGSAVSSGVFVPMLLMGACIGRFVGLATVNIAAAYGAGSDGAPPGVFLPPSPWSWIDPGLFALIGAGAFMGGVTRMTIALAVIIVEMSNDVRILLPAMVAIMLAKWVADAGCHSLYHGLMEISCIPFLPKRPSTLSSLELVEVRHVMAWPVVTLREKMRLRDVREALTCTRHNGFPIVKSDNSFVGIVGRDVLLKVLVESVKRGTTKFEIRYEDVNQGLNDPVLQLREQEQQLAVLDGSVLATSSMSTATATAVPSASLWEEDLDLRPFINYSAYRVSEDFSLDKSYLLFTTMGALCSCVVDDDDDDDDDDHYSLTHSLTHYSLFSLRSFRVASLGRRGRQQSRQGHGDAQGRVAVQASGGGGNRIVLHSGNASLGESVGVASTLTTNIDQYPHCITNTITCLLRR